MNQTEQKKLLQAAIDRFGGKAALAKAMERPLSTVAEWGKTRDGHFVGVPEWARMWIKAQVLDQPVPLVRSTQPWLTPGWPGDRRVAKAVRQLDRLVRDDEEKKLKLVLDLLDSLVEEET